MIKVVLLETINTQQSNWIINVDPSEVGNLQKTIEKINRKDIPRLGLSLITLKVGQKKTITVTTYSENRFAVGTKNVAVVEVELSGGPISAAGSDWEIASMPILSDAGATGAISYPIFPGLRLNNQQSSVLEKEIRKKYGDSASAGKICEFCNTDRDRLQNFIMRNKQTGELKAVGKSCLGKITHQTPEKSMLSFAVIDEIFKKVQEISPDEEGFWKKKSGDFFDLKEVMETTLRMIEKFGYLSSKAATEKGDTGTGTRVLHYLQDPRNVQLSPIDENTEEQARRIIDFVKNLPKEKVEESEYYRTANLLANSTMIGKRSIGYVVSFYGLYQNSQKDAASTAAAVNYKAGDKFADLPCEITKAQSMQTAYGPTVLYNFKGPSGENFSLFQKPGKYSNVDKRPEIGDKVTLSATVKQLNDRYKSIELTRGKFEFSGELPKKPEPVPEGPKVYLDYSFVVKFIRMLESFSLKLVKILVKDNQNDFIAKQYLVISGLIQQLDKLRDWMRSTLDSRKQNDPALDSSKEPLKTILEKKSEYQQAFVNLIKFFEDQNWQEEADLAIVLEDQLSEYFKITK